MTEAERLADLIERGPKRSGDAAIAKELRRLSAELEAAQKQMQAQKDEWLSWHAKRRSLEAAAIELEALKKAISEAQPVAHIRKNGFRFLGEIEPQDDSETPLYTLKGIK